MKGLLLAGGLGTRLRPLTEEIPKCLVEIDGRPLLEWWLDALEELGVDECFINTHYLAHMVEDYVFHRPNNDWISLVHEPTLLGTAGTIRSLEDKFRDDVLLVAHADNLALGSLDGLVAGHLRRPPQCQMTMLTFRSSRKSEVGTVVVDGNGVVVEYFEKDPEAPGNLANAAIFLVEHQIVNEIGSAADFSKEVLPRLVGRLFSVEFEGILIDIGTPTELDRARRLVKG
jgi:mannose-1-phosphate guanylyltransferase